MSIDHVHALPPGTRFAEYRLDAVLGAGGVGITYRAYDGHLEKVVAIKEYLPGEFAARAEGNTVSPHSSADAQDYQWGLDRFLDEARTLARFDHPHLNRVHRFFEANGTAYMVLEYVEGETLAERLGREPRLPEDMLRRLLEEVLSGLAVVHDAGYVHRDIKPGNLMLRAEDGGAVLLDFGSARQAVGRRSQRLTTILTPGYAPIEQYDSKAEDVGPWSDIYTLGMVAYRCVSGVGDNELPDAVTRGREQRKGGAGLTPAVAAGKGLYSPGLLEAIDWAIEVDEEARPQGVAAWSEALAGGGRGKGAPRPARKPATRPAKPPATKRAGLGWSGVALTLAIVALLGASAWQGWRLYRGMPEVDESGVVTAPEPQAGAAEDTASADSGGPETAPLTTEPEPAPPAEQDEVARLLAGAAADIEARRLTSPAGNNAWEKYQRVLELSPANPEAVAGMERVIGSYLELFGAALEREEFDKASDYLERVRELHPDSPVLGEGEQRLQAARQARAAREAEEAERLAELERQRQAAAAAREAELERERIAQAVQGHWEAFESALGEEDLDEAEYRLGRIRDVAPEAPELAQGGLRLDEAREAARQAAAKKLAVGEMVSIPGGSFRMGDLSGAGDDDEKPVHSVTVPAFRMGKYEVTVGQFRRFVEATGYRTDAERNAGGNDGCYSLTGNGTDTDWVPGRSWRDPGFSVGDDDPVACVSWNDARAFVRWLVEQTGEAFRLPSEAEWEYAARAGSASKYHFGNSESQLCRYANHADSSLYTYFGARSESCSDGVGARTTAVGRYQPNSYGLYDMHGNVLEWTQDCWNDSYAGAPSDGSAWTSGDCGLRVCRGGSWLNGPALLRSAYRNWTHRSYRSNAFGFRLAQDK